MVLTLPNHCGTNHFPRPCWEGPWPGVPNRGFQAAQTFSNTHTQLWISMLWWHVLTTHQMQHVVITLAAGNILIQKLRFDTQTKLDIKQKNVLMKPKGPHIVPSQDHVLHMIFATLHCQIRYTSHPIFRFERMVQSRVFSWDDQVNSKVGWLYTIVF